MAEEKDIRARAFDLIVDHLKKASLTETRRREQKRITIALRHIKRFYEMARIEIERCQSQNGLTNYPNN